MKGLASLLFSLAGLFVISRDVLGMAPQVPALLAIALSNTSPALVYHFLKGRELLRGPRRRPGR